MISFWPLIPFLAQSYLWKADSHDTQSAFPASCLFFSCLDFLVVQGTRKVISCTPQHPGPGSLLLLVCDVRCAAHQPKATAPLPGIQPSCSIPACFLITPPLAFFKVSWAETISFFHPQASWDYLSLTQFFATTVLVMFVCFVLFFFFFWSAPRSTYWIWEVCILFS